MAHFRDMIRRALNGRSPEEFVVETKERLHTMVNTFKDSPEAQDKARRYLQSVVFPLRYLNTFIIRPNLDDNEKLRALAQQYDVNKVELKRVMKAALELEEGINQYLGEDIHFDQLAITLRKVINVLDEQIITDLIEAMDHHINYGKIEKAYLTYQENLQKAYNAEGLNRDLQGILGQLVNGFKNALTQTGSKVRPSDRQSEIKMLDPQWQNAYDHYCAEGYTHEEAMAFIQERRDLSELSPSFLEAYRVLRQEGRPHAEALEYARSLAAKSTGPLPNLDDPH